MAQCLPNQLRFGCDCDRGRTVPRYPITGLGQTGILRVRIDAASVGRLYPVCGKY